MRKMIVHAYHGGMTALKSALFFLGLTTRKGDVPRVADSGNTDLISEARHVFTHGDIVTASNAGDAVLVFIREESNTDGRPNGIALVSVKDPGSHWRFAYRPVGSEFHIDMGRLSLAA